MSEGSEFTRLVKLDRLPTGDARFEADAGELTGLARRFDLPSMEKLVATLSFMPEGDAIVARGRLSAAFHQLCALAGEPFANSLEEPLSFRFVPALATFAEDEEVEFAVDEPDEIGFEGAAIDVGEAIAQSFGLALDPYAEGPDADAARKAGGISDDSAQRGPLADALGALKLRPED